MARKRYDISSHWLLHNQGKGAPELPNLLGGGRAMIESPLLVKLMAERSHKLILAALKGRFGAVPRDVTKRLSDVLDEEKLTALCQAAATCPDLAAFREALLS
jgi:hypothetical protein